LAPSQADDDGAMIPKYPPEGGEGDEAGEAVSVEQTFDFCHADIVTEFRSIAISISPGVFRGIRTLKGKNHPLNSAMNQKKDLHRIDASPS
jgi:hypothetical protein